MSLPPPCPQFMTRAERDIYLKEVKKDQPSQGQCLLQTDKSSIRTQNTTDHCNQKSRKRTRTSSSSQTTDKRKKRKSEIKEEVHTAEPCEQPTNAEPCETGPVATVLNCDGEKAKKRKRDDSEIESESELKKPKKSEIDCSVALYRRARTFSFPPLSGCTQYHGWQFWSGTEQMSQEPQPPAKLEKSTQTESRQRNWSDVEKRIDQLVKQGRNEAKRRKVHSKIQIPVSCKRRRKTRRRKRKKRRLSVFSKRYRFLLTSRYVLYTGVLR